MPQDLSLHVAGTGDASHWRGYTYLCIPGIISNRGDQAELRFLVILLMCSSEPFQPQCPSLLSRNRTTLKIKKWGTRAVKGTLFPLRVQELC